jgi:hypothetical protein
MKQFPCKVMISTLDRRKRYQTKKTFEQDTSFAIRYIKDDKSYHMVVKGGTKTEVFISAKLQISDNIATLGSIALNVPEFRSLVVIDELPEHGGVLRQILDILSTRDQENTTADDTTNKENISFRANQSENDVHTTTPEKQHPAAKKAEKKKLRSPLKSGCTPSKKKDRSACSGQRASPVKMTQMTSFLTATSSAAGRKSTGCRKGGGRESVAPDDVTLTQTQLRVLERCKEGANVFLTGGAGTGKSYLLKCILEEMVALYGKQAVFVTATTGIAAVNIGGTTVHQFAGIRPGDTVVEVTGDAVKQVHS